MKRPIFSEASVVVLTLVVWFGGVGFEAAAQNRCPSTRHSTVSSPSRY